MSDASSPPVIDLVSPDSKPSASRHRQVAKRHVPPVAATAAPDEIIVLSDDEEDTTRPLVVATSPQNTSKRKRQRRQGLPKDDREERGDIGVAERTVIDLLNDDPPGTMFGGAAPRHDVTIVQVSPELQVLEVFPDADLVGVRNLLGQCGNKTDIVLALMSERGYQKASTKAAPLHQPQNGGISIPAKPQTKWSYDFMAIDSFTPTPPYIKQAKGQLLYDFRFLTAAGIDVIFERSGNHYAKAHHAIVEALKGTGDDETKFHRVDKVLQGSPPLPDQAQRLNDYHKNKTGVVGKRKNFLKRWEPRASDPILREEILYVHGKFQQFLDMGRKHDTMEMKKQRAVASKTAVECSCCYDGYDIDDMVACSQEGHLFCVNCLKRFAESQIFGVGNLGIDPRTKKPTHDLRCFHGECTSGFDRLTLAKALPEKTLQKYDEMQCSISLEAAGLSNLVKCPKCSFQVELPYDQKFLVCPVESCKYASCRDCGEPAHIGIRCDEVEKEVETKGRVSVEEAISLAKIRHCPKCKKAFLKDAGCNKMTCGCGTKSCYICRQIIKDYDHFCQTPHCEHRKCRKCPLYTNDEEDDKRAMREAGMKAASQVPTAGIDVNDILKSPPPRSRGERN